jgi:glutamyl-Q tRNA(Asp) synthetase
LLRIDDLDTPRNVNGASDAILRCLERFGLQWDQTADYQSRHLQAYQQILAELQQQHWLYACRCSRKVLNNQTIYPGNCREAGYPDSAETALRLKTQDMSIEFKDGLQGWVRQNLALEHGDFVVRRRDQIIAYQFAVVIDDYRQEINHVVRGTDLLDSTPKQLYLQQLLHYPQPHYLHLPLIVDLQGCKLSKQTLAAPVDATQPTETLFLLLKLLQQNPPAELQHAYIQDQLNWAVEHWQPQALKTIAVIQQPQMN